MTETNLDFIRSAQIREALSNLTTIQLSKYKSTDHPIAQVSVLMSNINSLTDALVITVRALSTALSVTDVMVEEVRRLKNER